MLRTTWWYAGEVLDEAWLRPRSPTPSSRCWARSRRTGAPGTGPLTPSGLSVPLDQDEIDELEAELGASR